MIYPYQIYTFLRQIEEQGDTRHQYVGVVPGPAICVTINLLSCLVYLDYYNINQIKN